MTNKTIQQHLSSHNIKYRSMTHSPAFTAQEVAASAHVSGKQFAKIVVVKMGDQFALVVLPANEHINFESLKRSTGHSKVDLAAESEFKGKFPECEAGAMPPFGDLYGMPVYVSNHLTGYDQIIFNAGTHSELIQMSYRDFENLEHPKIFSA